MKAENHSITNLLISEEDIRKRLPSIFTDSIILNFAFEMIVVSPNVMSLLEFTHVELYRKKINYITGQFDFSAFLEKALKPGFFQEKYVEFFSKANRPVLTAVSGFYLGLISDINGYIILKVHDAKTIQILHKEREAKRLELDNFIYRTAHDIRGPLATIRGLINLYHFKKEEFDVDHLMQMIKLHAEQLDEKLFKLLYLAQVDQPASKGTHLLDTKALEAFLRKKIEVNTFIDVLDFKFRTSIERIEGVDEALTFELAGNILHFILNLPKSGLHRYQLMYVLSETKEDFEIKVLADGFEINDATRNIIANSETFYGDMLIHPEMFNYFAALKISLRMKASVCVNVTSQFNSEIVISIPRKIAM
jgi:signal transduction histidine kinase